MVLAVFGDIDRSEVLEIMKGRFGELRSGNLLHVDLASDPFPVAPRKAHKFMNKEQLAILIGFPGMSVTAPDRYPLEIITSFLNSQGGKLFQVVRDERGLAYSVGAFNILGIDPGAFVLITQEPKLEYPHPW